MERRLTTILAADVVGYSRLMGADEAGTLNALKAHRSELLDPKTAQYGGRTIKLMGDGALMEFASVVDAVSFAVDVQCAMQDCNNSLPQTQQILYRVGINIGDVIVEGDDIYGDGVNVAARLETLADPGGICIGRNVRNQVRDKLDLNLDDMGEVEVKNIARPIRVFQIKMDQKARALITPVIQNGVQPKPVWRSLTAAVMGLAALSMGGAALWLQPWAQAVTPAANSPWIAALPDKPSIAVLPFDNLSADTEQGYFADGITEDLITDLSKLSGVFVIARNSTFVYKGKPTNVQQIAKELGVRYVVEGSIRKIGDQLRINAQLIDAVGGHHLWADRYDGALTDVFSLQDKVIGKVVEALAVNLTSAEQAQTRHGETQSIEAYDAMLRGLDFLRLDNEDATLKAIAKFERAVELDPGYSQAYAALASAHWRVVLSFWWTTAGSGWQRAYESLETNLAKAMENPTPLAYTVSALLMQQQGRYDEAFAAVNQAIALAPNDPVGYVSRARILNATGRASEAERDVRFAMRLDPQFAPGKLRVLSMSLFHQEKYEETITTIERIVRQKSDATDDYTTLTSSLGLLGRSEGVKAAIEKYDEKAVAGGYDPLTVQEPAWFWNGDVFDYHKPYIERLQEGLRKAGVAKGTGVDIPLDQYKQRISRNVGEFKVDGATEIDTADAKKLRDRGVLFIDVRAARDFSLGYIEGATNLSLATALSNESLAKIASQDDEIVFYCHGKYCPYSAYAAAKAVEWGYKRVSRFAGGYPAWEEAGHPIERTATQ